MRLGLNLNFPLENPIILKLFDAFMTFIYNVDCSLFRFYSASVMPLKIDKRSLNYSITLTLYS